MQKSIKELLMLLSLNNDDLSITEWDESIIRQMVETVKVMSKSEIIVTLKGGAEINQRLEG